MPKPRPNLICWLCVGLLLAGCSGGVAASDAELVGATLRIDIDACRTGQVRATGIALDDGWIATVGHSFDGIVDYSVVGRDAQLVYLDIDRDIALLWGQAPEAPFLRLAPDAEPGPARIVTYPDPDMAAEISEINVIRLANVTLDGIGRRRALELSADISPGDSGSPVVDDRGRVIGMIFANSRGLDSGWAISVAELIGALDVAQREPIVPPTCG